MNKTKLLLNISLTFNVILICFLILGIRYVNQRNIGSTGVNLEQLLKNQVQDYENSIVGRELAFEFYDSLEPVGKTSQIEPQNTPFNLLLLFSEVDCNLCLDKQLEQLSQLHSIESNFLQVVGIVLGDDKRFAARFKRIRKIEYPFFSADKADIQKMIPMEGGPLALLVDNATNRIISVHNPVPELELRSDSYREYLLSLVR